MPPSTSYTDSLCQDVSLSLPPRLQVTNTCALRPTWPSASGWGAWPEGVVCGTHD